MRIFFRRKQPQAELELVREPAGEERRFYVPASVRPPEPARFSPPLTEADLTGDAGADEDIAFLRSLTNQIEGIEPANMPARPRPRFTARPAEAVDVREQDGLDVFRDNAPARERRPILQDLPNVRLGPVEMSDLLEDLNTTAAALRRKRAA